MVIQATQAQRGYIAAKPALTPTQKPANAGESFQAAATNFAAGLQETEATAKAAMVGKADPHALVMALTQSELAIETASTLRDKVVEAYQEIMRMPV
ncbi:flagellar hook-basal body complex protein FliE [Aliiruegeria sabulilitoris]|uniref:flagellar hook-basal body complex protein FliE n=1 Tax=Aliiruegeria sabulilitoris TaxID=1510458 RepID=UPI00082D5E71|nr:flagellar hook-basal body complex protein FliE [Aliiruegeria sabulilitoris]NDR58534.1 flagellar hook-basal body complex protein FliE [Pseudoruegeria sp. M32A2M]